MRRRDRARPARDELHRPAGGRTWTMAIKPALYPTSPPAATAKLLPGNFVQITLPAFFEGAADLSKGDDRAVATALTLLH